jgi:hypothetical protein
MKYGSKSPSLYLLALYAVTCTAQSVNLPKGTPLPVQIEEHLPMRVGQSVRAELIYPVYADNTLILPAKTIITGTAAGQRNIAAGIGYYGAAVAIYERWIKRGREVSFARDTRLVLQTTPRHSVVLTAPPL